MTATLTPRTANNTLVQDKAEEIKAQLRLSEKPKAIELGDMSRLFEAGVMTSVRITAERFSFSLKLSELGVVPTSDKRKDKVLSAIDAVLRTSQQGSLLPKDELWYIKDGVRCVIPIPEVSERRVRALFPTRYTGSENKALANPSFASWFAVPMNGMTFIPFNTWDQWKAEFEKAKAEHLNAAQIIVDNYDRIRNASLRHYSQIALDVYNRLQKTAPEQLLRRWYDPELGKEVERTIGALEWVRTWRKQVLGAWPSKEQIIAKYTVEERYFWAPRPSRVKINEEMLRYIEDMDAKDWPDEDSWKEWSTRKRSIIEQLWDDLEYANDIAKTADEKMAIMTISRQIRRTEKGQSHEMAIDYVRTLLERTESVFLHFLGTIQSNEKGITASQINMILRVSDMIKTMSNGVDSLKSIRDHAVSIERYINESSALQVALSKGRGKKRATSDALPDLPSIIANAVKVIREEAESIIGHDARRTMFSDQDPAIMLDQIMATGTVGLRSVRQSNGAEDGAPETAEVAYALPVPPPLEPEDTDELAVVRRIR